MSNNLYKKDCKKFKQFYWEQKNWRYFRILGFEFGIKVKTMKIPSGICANCGRTEKEHYVFK